MSAERLLAQEPADQGGVAVWAQYSKERYDAAEKRLADFRNWARQLASAVGVVVGLEAALLSLLLKLDAQALGISFAASLALLLASIAYQLFILGRAIARGYVGQESLGPESPVVLAGHVGDEASTRRMAGAYYAKGAENVHAIAEGVAKEVAGLARRFARSLWLLFVGMVLTVGLVAVSSFARKGMPDTPASTGPAPSGAVPSSGVPATPAQSPSGTSPATSPMLATPTPGQTETRAAPPPQTILATPTPGQRVTEGVQGKRN